MIQSQTRDFIITGCDQTSAYAMATVAEFEECAIKLHPSCRQLLVWRRS